MLLAALAPCLLLPATAEPLPARPLLAGSEGGLRAEVRDRQGAPVPGVRILLKHPDGRVWATSTNAQGQFRAGGLPPAEYQVELHKAAYPNLVLPKVRIKANAWLLGMPPAPPELRSTGGRRLSLVGPPTYEAAGTVFAPAARPELGKIPMH